ncbi:MAG: uroporphyrinogen decarboxylase family protein [Anaerolineae bacterium]
MDSRERVWRTLRFETPDRIPTDAWVVPATWSLYGDDLRALLDAHPTDFGASGYHCPWEPDVLYEPGAHPDAWGVVWHNEIRGLFPYPSHFPCADDDALRAYQPPFELAEEGCEDIPATVAANHERFILAGGVRIFERMQWLRGCEQLLMDIAEDSPLLYTLRDRVQAFNMRNLKKLLSYDVDGIFFLDDWGSQESLLIRPEAWRRVFAPCYEEMFAAVHAAGKAVFFHTDGQVTSIVEDLHRLGVDALNCQVTCMDLAAVGRAFRGRVCFWGEPDRQHVLNLLGPVEVQAHLRELVEHLSTPAGGLIGQFTAMPDVPLANVAVCLSGWDQR